MILKDVVQKSLKLQHASLADGLVSYPATDFYATIAVMLVGIPDLNQKILHIRYGLRAEENGCPVKEVINTCFPHLSANAAHFRIRTSLQLLLHPVRLKILSRAVQGQPFTLEGQDRPITFLSLSTRALTILARAGIYSEQDLVKGFTSGELLSIPYLNTRICTQIESKLSQTCSTQSC